MGPTGSITAGFPALSGNDLVNGQMPSGDADPSPTNNDLVWAPLSQVGTELPIYLAHEDGRQTDLTRVTGVGGFNTSPKFSPDGKLIAFQHRPAQSQPVGVDQASGSPQVWVMTADGRYAHPSPARGSPSTAGPLWFPDGKRVLVSVPGKSTPYEVSLATGAMRPRPELDGATQWSPDGKKLAALRSKHATRHGQAGYLNQLLILDPRGRLLRVAVEQFLPDAKLKKYYPARINGR